MNTDLDRLLTHTSRAKKFLDPLLKELGTHRWADVEDAIIKGRLHLISTPHAAAVGELVRYPLKTIFTIHWAAGKKKELQVLQPELEEWAREKGADAIEIRGRRGWMREYKNDLDHNKIMVSIQKDL